MRKPEAEQRLCRGEGQGQQNCSKEPSARLQPRRSSSWSGPKREQLQLADQWAPCILRSSLQLRTASPSLSGVSGPYRTGLSWLKHKKALGQTSMKNGYSTPLLPREEPREGVRASGNSAWSRSRLAAEQNSGHSFLDALQKKRPQSIS